MRSTIILLIIANIIHLSTVAYRHKQAIDNEYFIVGKGSYARMITKKENPGYYESRMKYMWVWYVLFPILSVGIIFAKIKIREIKKDRREFEKKRSDKAN